MTYLRQSAAPSSSTPYRDSPFIIVKPVSPKIRLVGIMATQQDLQELIRLLTVSRKMPMIQAMGQIKALQTVDLKRCAPYRIHLSFLY